MEKYIWLMLTLALVSCRHASNTIHPRVAPISESVYASGTIKSKDQYQAFSTAGGVIEKILVKEGDSVKKGTPILVIANTGQSYLRENAALNAAYTDISANAPKVDQAKSALDVAYTKMLNDSALYFRQLTLWNQQIGSKAELEQRNLLYQNSISAWKAASTQLNDLTRQLQLNAAQSKNNLLIAQEQENNFTLVSEMDGIIYDLLKSDGEMVGPQTPLAVIGAANQFVLEMQVDEADIFKIQPSQSVLVTMDAYKDEVYEATITAIAPIMNTASKTFEVEAVFLHPPQRLYPNITFEANIILRTKQDALLLPRDYLLNDSTVIKDSGDTVKISIGLKDYQQVEIISGITADDAIIQPGK